MSVPFQCVGFATRHSVPSGSVPEMTSVVAVVAAPAVAVAATITEQRLRRA